MSQLFNLWASPLAKQDVVEFAKDLFTRATLGRVSGVFFVVASPGEDDEIGVCGEFAEDIDYAVRSANSGMSHLFELKNSTVRQFPLPRHLRKRTP